MRLVAAGALALAALAAGALPALAAAPELPGLSLAWEAPAGCPDRDALLARVAELVGERGGQQSHAPLALRAVLTEQGDGSYHAELHSTQDGAERTRELDAPSCEELSEASAVVVALALSPPTADEAASPREDAEPRRSRAEPAKPPPSSDAP
ncbi:MAG TPA: hypothetical protein VGQ57_08070, partial [Polyangiaceae bacterium]|nr:hypothetical protein [Polyangiaceae bacterium]